MDKLPSFTYQRFDSRRNAQSAFDTAIESARHIVRVFDRDGGFYGFDRPVVSDLFNDFLHRARDAKITLIMQHTHFLSRDCPRLRHLMQLHGQRITILKAEGLDAGFERGFVLVDNSVVLRRPHFDHPTTIWDIDAQQIAGADRLFGELESNAKPGLSAATTGL